MGRASAELTGLNASVLREAQAARRLGATLAEARCALEERDAEAFQTALGKAQPLAEELRQAGVSCAFLTGRLAGAAGLAQETRLEDLARRPECAEGLAGGVEELGNELKALETEAAALGIVARYGSRFCDHLVGLRRSALGAGYDPRGRLTHAAAANGRRA